MGKLFQNTKNTLIETYKKWRDDRTIRLGAGLAYYAMFGVAPLVILAVLAAGIVFTSSEIKEFITPGLQEIFGENANEIIQRISDFISRDGFFSGLGVIGLGTTIVSASFVFLALQDSLNLIWRKPVKSGIKQSIRKYMIAYVVVIVTSLVLLASLIIFTIVNSAENLFPEGTILVDFLGDLTVTAGLWLIGIGLLATLYKSLSYINLPWKQTLYGASATWLLLVLGTRAAGWYLQNYAGESYIGAAGIFVVVPLWLYYEAQILLFGAQLTKVIVLKAYPGITKKMGEN